MIQTLRFLFLEANTNALLMLTVDDFFKINFHATLLFLLLEAKTDACNVSTKAESNVSLGRCRFFDALYLSQIVKFICLKIRDLFVSNFKMYLSQILNVFDSLNKL